MSIHAKVQQKKGEICSERKKKPGVNKGFPKGRRQKIEGGGSSEGNWGERGKKGQ